MKKLWKQGLTMAMAAMMATAVPVSGLTGAMGPMTAMASPMNNNSDEIVTKSISKGKIGRSMNINFVVRNESGGDWENVVVGIEEQDFTMSKPNAIDGDYVFPFEITENNFKTTTLGSVEAGKEKNASLTARVRADLSEGYYSVPIAIYSKSGDSRQAIA